MCLLSARGPQWLSYYSAQLALPDIKAEFDHADKVKLFYREALAGLPVECLTLLMVSEQNVGRFWLALNLVVVDSIGDAFDGALLVKCSWRIAWICLFDGGMVLLISLLCGFGCFVGSLLSVVGLV